MGFGPGAGAGSTGAAGRSRTARRIAACALEFDSRITRRRPTMSPWLLGRGGGGGGGGA